jgi:hypothetical protein
MADTDIPKIGVKDLKQHVQDAEELRKGTEIFDAKGIEHLARFQSKVFADAKGSGASPYKVQLQFADGAIKARCSCMAARTRPVCKHAAALLVAWARAPEGFAVAEAAPASAGGEAKKKAVKAGKTDANALMKGGVEQVATLVRELALSGVATLSTERAAQVRALGETLREARLRRLSARVIDMASRVAHATTAHASFDATEYAELFADTLMTVRKLEKHLAGEALDDKHVEELIGKTWTKKDRKAVADLELVEYSFSARVTPDNYVIRESRFIELESGAHYSEKQIIPSFLAARTEPKKSYAGWVLEGAAGSLYPSFAPYRLDLESEAERAMVSGSGAKVLDRVLAKCLPSVTAALAAFQEHRKDVFAPDAFPVAVAVQTVLAEHDRLQAVDADNAALFLPDDTGLEERLAGALRQAKLEALVGDIVLEGPLPTLVPHAALVTGPEGRELRPLGGGDSVAMVGSRKLRFAPERGDAGDKSSRGGTARAAGMSGALIALGEVREELAGALTTGLTGMTPRFAEPLAARLAELGLAKPAELLKAAAARPDAAERLDDFIKVFQVLGIAMVRLAGAAHVDRSKLVPVPTYESVHVHRSEAVENPRETARRVAEGELNRYQAAVRYAAWYEKIGPEALAKSIYPTWADGSAGPFVARAFAARPDQALAAASSVLQGEGESGSWWVGHRAHARVARLTAINVAATVATAPAREILSRFAKRTKDPTLKAIAERALGTKPDHAAYAEVRDRLVSASNREERVRAAGEAADKGMVEAIPALRASFAADVSGDVREAAALALGRLGDVESVDTFVRMLRRRREDAQAAKTGAYSLGWLGDVRGIDALLDAWAEGWQPMIVSEAMTHIGTAALEPLLDRVEEQPELVKRKAASNVVLALDAREVASVLCARLERNRERPEIASLASVYVTLASAQPAVFKTVAAKVLELLPRIREKGATKEEKALLRKCEQPTPEKV